MFTPFTLKLVDYFVYQQCVQWMVHWLVEADLDVWVWYLALTWLVTLQLISSCSITNFSTNYSCCQCLQYENIKFTKKLADILTVSLPWQISCHSWQFLDGKHVVDVGVVCQQAELSTVTHWSHCCREAGKKISIISLTVLLYIFY